MSNKNCDICNREKRRPYGKTPSGMDVYLNDIFVVVDCDCGKELVVCEDCLERSYHDITYKLIRCKSCNRDKKIEDLL
jgi:hypothetical protein